MNQPAPLVSIGLPVYNGEDYLAEALNSLLNQTFSDFELIICDNASTDGTQALCEAYAARDPRVRYERNPANLGAAANYNRCFALARGRYFRWHAHDDRVAPTHLERCVEVLDRAPDVILVYPQTMLIDQDGRETEPYDDNFRLRSPEPQRRFRGFFSAKWLCNPVFGLIRREVLARTALIGSYRASDRVLLGELSLLGQFEEVPERLFFKRMHPQMSTRANLSDSELANWFDPAQGGRLLYLPRWRWVREYARAIWRAPMPSGQRLHCYWHLFRRQIVTRAGLSQDREALRYFFRQELPRRLSAR